MAARGRENLDEKQAAARGSRGLGVVTRAQPALEPPDRSGIVGHASLGAIGGLSATTEPRDQRRRDTVDEGACSLGWSSATIQASQPARSAAMNSSAWSKFANCGSDEDRRPLASDGPRCCELIRPDRVEAHDRPGAGGHLGQFNELVLGMPRPSDPGLPRDAGAEPPNVASQSCAPAIRIRCSRCNTS